MARRFLFSVVLIVVVIAVFSVLSGVLHAQGNREAAFERVKEVQQRHTEKLLAKKGVVGTAVGYNHDRKPAIKVFVTQAGVADIPRKIDGVPVQVVITGEIRALRPPAGKGPKPKNPPVDRTSRFDRPVPIGVSTGHPDITAGTIGCRVTKGGNVYALSNNHVYADENKATHGDTVLQPGRFDGGQDPADEIGTLDAFERIKFNGLPNVIDAAIALSSTSNLGNATPSDGYGLPKSTTLTVDYSMINQSVKKYGRTTGLTKGRIYAINAIVEVGYDSGTALFMNQIIITPGSFSGGGDSGSLVVFDGKRKTRQDDRKAIGLLFAGSNMITVINPINPVLSRFGVTIDGE